MTLMLTFLSCVVGTLFGLAIALGLVRRNPSIRHPLTLFVEVARACPPLVLLIWAFYLVPTLSGVSLSATATAMLVFTVVFAVFAADVFRGAIEAIPRALLDSGRVLGMPRITLLRRIIVPEVFRRSLPALNGQAVGLLKMSSLASVISVHELTYSAQLILAQRPLPFEIYTVTAGAYCLLVLPMVLLLRWVERQAWCALNPSSHALR